MSQVTKLGPGGYPVAFGAVNPSTYLVGVSGNAAVNAAPVNISVGLVGIRAIAAFGIAYSEPSLNSVRASAAANHFGIAQQFVISGVSGASAFGTLSTSANRISFPAAAHAFGSAGTFGILIDVSAGKTHGKGKGHGNGKNGTLRIELDSALAFGRTDYPGFIAHSENTILEGIIGVKASGAIADFDFTIDSDATAQAVSGTANVATLVAGNSSSLTDIVAVGAIGSASNQIDPDAAISAAIAHSATSSISVNVAEATQTNIGLPIVSGVAVADDFGISFDRDLQQGINQAFGIADEIIESTQIDLAAAAASGTAGSFSNINVGVVLSPALALGMVDEFAITHPIVIPICELNAQMRTGLCRGTMRFGSIEMTVRQNVELRHGIRCD